MKITLILCICAVGVFGFNFDTKDVSEIRLEKSIYFGYSLLLQKGPEPLVIVGAPRQDGDTGGSMYKCFINGNCDKYSLSVDNTYSFTGNYLGAALDGSENVGEQFFACAPKVVTANKNNSYLMGWCFIKNNSSNYDSNYDFVIQPLAERKPTGVYKGNRFYDYGLAEAGVSVHYIKKTKKLLLGAPGVKNYNGAVVVQDLNNLKQYTVIPQQLVPILSENDGYLGYEVTSAYFEPNRTNIWYIVGAPRANKLRGKVNLFNELGNSKMIMTGDEMGSYFGSSIVAVDLNNDRRDDLLIGAPMGAGHTWDEGYVYYYKSSGDKFESSVKLYGSRQTGSRFGTSIVSLGDIDLDSYNDVAISAPYENEGTGVVYIYMGSINGIKQIYSQKLSPLSFKGNFNGVRGFGLGLSKGVDIDGNGHNDLAIGAYKSNQVFIVKTISVIDCDFILDTNVSSISSDSMNIKYYSRCTKRSQSSTISTVTLKVQLSLDYRVKGETDFEYIWNVTLSKNYSKSMDIKMKQNSADILPFKISLKANIMGNVIGVGDKALDKFIPYSHGCGDDDICQTQILLDVIEIPPAIILGYHKVIIVNVTAENVGEPGYECNLQLNFPAALEFRDKRDCNFLNSTYICPFATRLIWKKDIQLKFDIKQLEIVPENGNLQIDFELKCLGENIPEEIQSEVLLDVSVINSPYIVGKSEPENFYYNDESVFEDVEISHVFTVGNSGPSPVKLNIILLLPVVKKDGANIFEVSEAEGTLNGMQVQCSRRKATTVYEKHYPGSLLTESLNRTFIIDCVGDDMECLEFFCEGGYLYKSTEIAEYSVKIIAKTTILASHYKSILGERDIIAYTSAAFLHNTTHRIEGHTATLIFASNRKPIPIWIYVAGAVAGSILLALVILLLYACHFFDRTYRDKMNDEKLMEQNLENEDDIKDASEEQIQEQESEETL